jgi:hypothetical protein
MKTEYFLRIVAQKGSNGEVVDTREFESATPFGSFNVGHLFNWDNGVLLPIVKLSHAVIVMWPGESREVLAHWVTIIVDIEKNMHSATV